ncbi:hypothetical protein Pmi06nite_63760 [Planotetraspora mira]|uniref:Uncharacterized protein n=1 Tax=Planotetraspora mira TaxID=58121 RepID=A0A8J3TV86_9ACTN|nr:hypothetical protein Pmi06nite_63760 [Planotetraspora mira]
MRSKAAKIIVAAADKPYSVKVNGSGLAVARAQLGAPSSWKIFAKARLLRLFKATDALAWAPMDAWDGQSAYVKDAQAVRRVLAAETLDGAPIEPVAVSLMNMHKSKGKGFDAVIIAEDRSAAPLPDFTWNTTGMSSVGASSAWP